MTDLVKFLVCGNVDDGKSTLIGHLLYNNNSLYLDQKEKLLEQKDIDYSLLLDGLSSEMEQKITIDVAYRYFSTDKKNFIVLDTPGHEEYTKNMAVAAAQVDTALILIDVTKSLTTQTKRHINVCNMFGIKNYIFAINKMDLVNYSEKDFTIVKNNLEEYLSYLNISKFSIIPTSGYCGDNLNNKSQNLLWYNGPCLLDILNNIKEEEKESDSSFMIVQRVCRPNIDFRGYQGEINSGNLKVGDLITVQPSNETACIKNITAPIKKVETAAKGMPVTIELDKQIDVSRGNVICKNTDFNINSMFNANILWMDDEDLNINGNYIIKIGCVVTKIKISKVNYKINLDDNSKSIVEKITKNDLINCDIITSKDIIFDKFNCTKDLGEFIIINELSNQTSACGIILENLNQNYLFYQNIDITKEMRSNMKNQVPKTIWFTGLSCSGKSTLANALERYLTSLGKHTMLLDGDNIRLGINKDLSFSIEDRNENLRRVANIAKLFNDAGIICITSFITPLKSQRKMIKDIIGDDYIEVYVNTDIKTCAKRDKKGLYQKAFNNEISNFTGVNSPYEIPSNPDIIINNNDDLDDAIKELIKNIEISE